MEDTPAPRLLPPDGEIQSLEADRLHRQQFARNLAHSIDRRQNRESFVVALQGPWGCGKSSIKNMMKEALGQLAKAPVIMEFKPWLLRDEDAVFTSFFTELRLAVGAKSGDNSELNKRLNAYNRRLALGETVADSLAALGLAVGQPGVALGLKSLAKVFGKGSQIAKQGAEATGEERASLPELKKALQEALQAALEGASMLVIIDDIDRLPPKEIALLLQLVKSNADFPGFTYLLLYQKETVEAALHTIYGVNGHEYLEKIVQLPIDVPPISAADLPELLKEGIEEVCRQNQMKITEDDFYRIDRLWGHGLDGLIGNVRDVRRLINSFDFTGTLLHNEAGWEVDVADFLALEALRLEQPALFSQLPRYKDLLTQPMPQPHRNRLEFDLMDQSGKRSTFKDDNALFDDLKGNIQGNEVEKIHLLLGHLFPYASWAFTGNEVLESAYNSKTSRDIRGWQVGARAHFDRYFKLHIPQAELSEKRRKEILQLAKENPPERQRFIDALFGLLNSKEMDLFCRLTRERLAEVEPDLLLDLLIGLTDFCDLGPQAMLQQTLVSPSWESRMDASVGQIRHLFCSIVESGFETGVGQTLFLESVQMSFGLYLPALAIGFEEAMTRQRDQHPHGHRLGARVFEHDFLNQVREVCTERIRVSKDKGELWNHKHAKELVEFWATTNRGEVQSWLKSEIDSTSSLVELLCHFAIRSEERPVDFPREFPTFVGDDALIDIAELTKRIRELDQMGETELGERGHQIIKFFL